MSASLGGKIAVITGGSSGIGAATARLFAGEGATIVVSYHAGAERAAALLAELPGTGHRAVRIVLDDSATIRVAAKMVADSHGRADILVNCAGFTRKVAHGDLDGLDDALLDRMFAVNVRGTFAVIRAFAPLLKAGGDGVIINVSSVSAFTGSGSNIAYCAAKAALDTMTISLARVLGPQVRVLSVSPAAVATNFIPGRERSQLEAIAAGTPLKRVVEPEDIARTVLACVTHLKASTGVRIVADGGRSIT